MRVGCRKSARISREIFVTSAVIVACNVSGSYALSRGLHGVGVIDTWSPVSYIIAFAHPWVLAGVLLLIGWFLTRLALLSYADLTYALPLVSLSYVFTALTGVLFLNEHLGPLPWAGIFLVTLGAAVVGSTPPRTTQPKTLHGDLRPRGSP